MKKFTTLFLLFLLLQATECYLANVIPPEGAEEWPMDAAVALHQIVSGKVKLN